MSCRHFVKSFTLVLSFFIVLTGSFIMGGAAAGNCVYAIADIPKGTASGTTYTVKDTIYNWNQLEGLMSGKYKTIRITSSYIKDNDLSHFIHLGEESGVSKIPQINYRNVENMYPPKILPAYDSTTNTFAMGLTINNKSGHGTVSTFNWGTGVSYVYDSSRDNCVTINHEVVDENGQVLLPYVTSGSGYDSRDNVNNRVSICSVNNTEPAKRQIKLTYDKAISAYLTPTRPWDSELNYIYTITPVFFSTVKLDSDVCILGSLSVSDEDKAGNPIAGTEYAVYSDAACTQRAKQYIGGSWAPASDIQTDSTGSAQLNNLRPGTYYVREESAADGYETVSEVKTFTIAEDNPDLSLDKTSGEGTSRTINAENVLLSPEWEANGKDTVLGFDEDESNYETAVASDYNDGAELFIKKAGNSVKFADEEDVATLDGLDRLTSGNVRLEVGSISNSYSTLSEAVDYVNNELIDAGGIDNEEARDHVTIYTEEELLYADSDKQATVEFVSAGSAAESPVTGLDERSYALPLLLVAAIGLVMPIALRYNH